MSTLLLGRWDHAGDLRVEESYQVLDDDQDTIDDLVHTQDNTDGMAWACTFDVDSHRVAIQRAFDEYVRSEGTRLVDEVEGVEPVYF